MVKMFWLTVVTFFIVAYFLAGCAPVPPPEIAQPKKQPVFCGPAPAANLDGLHVVLVENNPSSLAYQDLNEPDEKAQFIAAFNASPPRSAISLDAIIRIYHRFDSINLLVVIADKRGCVRTAQEFPRPQVLLWLRGNPTVPSIIRKKPKSEPKQKGHGA